MKDMVSNQLYLQVTDCSLHVPFKIIFKHCYRMLKCLGNFSKFSWNPCGFKQLSSAPSSTKELYKRGFMLDICAYLFLFYLYSLVFDCSVLVFLAKM